MTTAIRAADFIGTLGVNTHIDFAAYGYQNLSVVESAINYLGLKNLRDSPESAADVGSKGTWQQVATATGAKFDAYIPEGSPANMQASLNLIPQLASQGILNAIEGGNEEDDAYAASNGNTLQITADFQKNYVWPLGQKLGLPVINMSFGAGWTAANGWIGDYASVGDLQQYATYGNAHTYPAVGQTPDSTIQRINGLAQLADSTDPVVTTEIGWDRNQGYSQQTVAKFVLDATMDGIKDGDVKTYFYGLFDDGAGKFGLMNQNGTPMAAGTALHNLTTLLADTGATASTFTTGSLSYSLSHTTANDNALLFQKSDGTYWISLWNEVDAAHTVTVTLSSPATEIKVFDPLSGTTATKDVKSASSVSVRLTDHPLLVEVYPSSTQSPPPPPPSPQPNDLVVNVPTSGDTVTANTTSALPGVSVTDPWAAQSSGSMALNLWDSSGAPLYVNGQQVTGTLSLTLNQLNADLAGLSYKAGAAGSDTVTVDVWNQAGVEATKSFTVTIAAGAAPAAAGAANALVTADTVTTAASSSDRMHFIGGAHDAVTAGGGSNSVTPLVMAGTGREDVHGFDHGKGDTIDFRTVLKETAWDGRQSTLGNFLHVGTSGHDAIVTVSAAAHGAAVATLDLHDSGPLTMDGLLAHAIT